jgi:hypothetical protein
MLFRSIVRMMIGIVVALLMVTHDKVLQYFYFSNFKKKWWRGCPTIRRRLRDE